MNALEEFLPFTQYECGIKCADIIYVDGTDETRIILPLRHTVQNFAKFLIALNFDYDNDYGTRHLFGTVWFNDGTWASRSEYEGKEWWLHNICPNVPTCCNLLNSRKNHV